MNVEVYRVQETTWGTAPDRPQILLPEKHSLRGKPARNYAGLWPEIPCDACGDSFELAVEVRDGKLSCCPSAVLGELAERVIRLSGVPCACGTTYSIEIDLPEGTRGTEPGAEIRNGTGPGVEVPCSGCDATYTVEIARDAE